MKIKYYNFEEFLNTRYYYSGYDRDDENSWINKNYISKELALSAALKNHIPSCEVSSIKLLSPALYKIEKEIRYEYSTTKIDKKTGKHKIISSKEVDITVETHNFRPYNRSFDEFKNISNNYYSQERENNKGFYRLKFGDLITEKGENQINYKKQIFVKFFAAEVKKTSEIKEPGKPYQPASEELVETEISDWMVIYFNKGYNGWLSREDDNYSIEQKHNSEIYYIKSSIEITEKTIDILEEIP